VERLQASDGVLGRIMRRDEVNQANAFETLEHPAQRRATSRLLGLTGHRLAGGHQSLVQPVLGEPVDQQAEQHHHAEGDGALLLLDEDRGGQKERILKEGEAPFHAALLFVRLEELLIGQLRGIEHIGDDQEGSLAPRLAGEPGEQRGRVVRVEPVEGPSQAVVVEPLRADPRPQEALHRLGRKELRDQIQPAIAEAQSLQDHRDRRRPHTNLLLARACQRIQIRGQPDLLALLGHDPQVIQLLDSHPRHEALLH
jgi:hypothetical protein